MIQEPDEANFFDYEYEYGTQDGFQVAFGLVSYDNSSNAKKFDDTLGTL